MERSIISRLAVIDAVIADLQQFHSYQAIKHVQNTRTRLEARWKAEEKQHRHNMLFLEPGEVPIRKAS